MKKQMCIEVMSAGLPHPAACAIKETDPAELIQLALVGLHGYVTLALKPLQSGTFKKTVHEILSIIQSGRHVRCSRDRRYPRGRPGHPGSVACLPVQAA